MAGYVGAGGLGDYSITYGYNYNRMDIVWASVIAIVVLVCIIQMIGTLIAKRNIRMIILRDLQSVLICHWNQSSFLKTVHL